jgi:hypothetical protein
MSITTDRLDPTEQAIGSRGMLSPRWRWSPRPFIWRSSLWEQALGFAAISPGFGVGIGNFSNDVQNWRLRYLLPPWEDIWRRACAPSEQRCEGLRALFAEGAGCGYSVGPLRFEA